MSTEIEPYHRPLDTQQKANIGVIAAALHMTGVVISADEVYDAWPVGGDLFQQTRAGKRPSRNQIAKWLGSKEGKDDLLRRGLPITHEDIIGSDTLTAEQWALINILSDTSLRVGLDQRLKRAGVTRSKYRAWRRNAAFSRALKKIVPDELAFAAENIDIVLTSKAQAGDLNAIKYWNELMGRGPNSNKDVDAAKFSRLVLEAVMRHCSKDQITAIAADIELASKQSGLETLNGIDPEPIGG